MCVSERTARVRSLRWDSYFRSCSDSNTRLSWRVWRSAATRRSRASRCCFRVSVCLVMAWVDLSSCSMASLTFSSVSP